MASSLGTRPSTTAVMTSRVRSLASWARVTAAMYLMTDVIVIPITFSSPDCGELVTGQLEEAGHKLC